MNECEESDGKVAIYVTEEHDGCDYRWHVTIRLKSAWCETWDSVITAYDTEKEALANALISLKDFSSWGWDIGA